MVEVSNLLLDPNNPRLEGLTRKNATLEERIGDPSVQNSVFSDLTTDGEPLYDEVKSTRDSIQTLGLLSIDRIVVRPYNSGAPSRYVVTEGNERVAALKWILKDQASGELTLPPERLAKLQRVEVLALQGTQEEIRKAQWIIQGVRHILGVHQWGPYQKAKTILEYLGSGMDVRAVSETLSIKVPTLNRLRRAYLALENFKDDEEYGQSWDPNMFSYFEEVMKSPYLREDWLGWTEESETQGEFANSTNLKNFYSWITTSEENGEKKVPEAIHVRYLPDVLRDEEIGANFVNDPTLAIGQAYARIQARQAAAQSFDWRGELRRLHDILQNRIPLGPFSETDVTLFEQITTAAREKVDQIRRLATNA